MAGEAAATIDATVLLVGQGVLADALARRLPRVGLELERAQTSHAAQIARVAAPDLIVLVGDSAGDGGKRVLAQLAGDASIATLPVLVICGPSLAVLGGIALRTNVAALASEGGIDVCALRIQRLLERFADVGFAGRTLQQAVDEAAAAPRPAIAPRPAATVAPAVLDRVPSPAGSAPARVRREQTLVGIPTTRGQPAPAPAPVVAPPAIVAPAPVALPAPVGAAALVVAAAPAVVPRPLVPSPVVTPGPNPRTVPMASARARASAAPPSVDPAIVRSGTSNASAALADEVEWLDEPTRDAQTPLSWPTPPSAASAHASVAPQAPPRARRPHGSLLAAAAVLVLLGGGLLARLGSSASGAHPAAVTGAIAPAPTPSPRGSRSKSAEVTAPNAARSASSAPVGNRVPALAAGVAPAAAEPEHGSEVDDAEDEIDPPGRARSNRNEQIALANRNVGEGNRSFKRGHLGLAEAAYLKALAVLPGYPRAMAALARVHLKRRDGSEAVRWAERLVARQPRRGNNQLLLGDAWALRGNDARARTAWQRAASYGNATARKRLK